MTYRSVYEDLQAQASATLKSVHAATRAIGDSEMKHDECYVIRRGLRKFSSDSTWNAGG